jgi:putative copper resistance protein D
VAIVLVVGAGFPAVAAAAPQATQKPAPKSAVPARNPIPATEASIKAGRTVYAKICRACHGLQGRGDGVSAPPGTKPANLVDAEWKYGESDAAIFKTIKEGIKPFDVMEPWGKKISDADIWHTINFLRDLAAKQPGKKK